MTARARSLPGLRLISVKAMDEKTRFMKHVGKDADGCWRWLAYKMPSGYGNFRTHLRHELAHRSSYRLFRGPLDARDVMHSCDNPSCVNPDHLSLGARKENMADAAQKGRSAKGESHGRSKLTEQQIDSIRSSALLQRQIAHEFGISQGHVSAIRGGKKWGHPHEGNYHR